MVSSANNPINNKVGANISGVTNTLTVTNPSNTASSAARETITVGGGTAGDPTINWNISGVTDWEMGADNSVSDNLTISQSTALGTKDVWRCTTAGIRTMPLQPCASIHKTTNTAAATGDGTVVTVIWDTVQVDQGSNYNNATGQFTCPITASYFITAGIFIGGLTVAHTQGFFNLAINGIGYFGFWNGNPANVRDPGGGMSMNANSLLFLNAGDIITMQVIVSNGAKTVDVGGGQFGVTLIY